MFKTQITRRLIVPVATIMLCAMSAPGCHRSHYRRQADAEAKRLIAEKSQDPRWNSSTGDIELDPQSRMFDPFSKDHPPIPPDDPASHQFMKCVDGKSGYPHWHVNGDTDQIANPEWRSYLPINEKGQVVIDIDSAIRLAFLHSPDLQQQKETLYLSALDVSLDRFGFDSQLFAGFNSFLTTQGRLRNGTGRSSTTLSQQLGANGQGINFNKLGVTGANFAVGLANSILWNFAGADTQTATSLIDFSLIQPLLRGAGRDRIMESLTQAERTLLANVRQMDRFRRGFYLEVITGRNAGAGPNRGGNFLGLPGSANGNAGGFMGLLLQQQLIKIQQFNVKQLQGSLNQFREFFLRERVDSLQLRQFEVTVLQAQQNLLDLKTNYQTSLDFFKRTVGIPPDVDVLISDPSLSQFELISDDLTERQTDLATLKNVTGEILIQIGSLLPPDPEFILDEEGNEVFDESDAPQEWPDDMNKTVKTLESYVQKAIATLELVETRDLKEVERDIARLESVRPSRVKYLRNLQKQIASGAIESEVEPAILDPDSVREADELKDQLADSTKKMAKYKESFQELQQTIRDFPNTRERLGDNEELKKHIRVEILEALPEKLTEFTNTVLELSLTQALARADSVEIPDIELDADTAFKIARCFRRDWMNARASLVDRWRQIEFVADQLEAQVDLVFQGDIGNTGDNPFKLRYETGQLRAGFRFDAPIVRMSERNQYRETLINYQQSKRSYYQFEDEVHRNLREILRDINLNKILYEINRKSIQIRIEEVESARFRLEEPARPGATRSALGSTTARDLTGAINGLQSAQNAFLRTWVTYEVLRRSLDFDLGTMQVDGLGNWVDPGKIDATIAERAAATLGITLDQAFCCELPDAINQAYALKTEQSYQMDRSSSESANSVMDVNTEAVPESPDELDYYERPAFEPESPDGESSPALEHPSFDAPSPDEIEPLQNSLQLDLQSLYQRSSGESAISIPLSNAAPKVASEPTGNIVKPAARKVAKVVVKSESVVNQANSIGVVEAAGSAVEQVNLVSPTRQFPFGRPNPVQNEMHMALPPHFVLPEDNTLRANAIPSVNASSQPVGSKSETLELVFKSIPKMDRMTQPSRLPKNMRTMPNKALGQTSGPALPARSSVHSKPKQFFGPLDQLANPN